MPFREYKGQTLEELKRKLDKRDNTIAVLKRNLSNSKKPLFPNREVPYWLKGLGIAIVVIGLVVAIDIKAESVASQEVEDAKQEIMRSLEDWKSYEGSHNVWDTYRGKHGQQ